jgi:hypothetical protein
LKATAIDKYSKKSYTELKKKAVNVFNSWISKRDKNLGCISCGSYHQIQAGHYYSAGHYELLRFNEDNVHSQCLRCNYFLSGNLTHYRENLINKIGIERLEKLDELAKISKRQRMSRHDRFYLIELIEKYKLLKI